MSTKYYKIIDCDNTYAIYKYNGKRYTLILSSHKQNWMRGFTQEFKFLQEFVDNPHDNVKANYKFILMTKEEVFLEVL